jgi:hypothetical protein
MTEETHYLEGLDDEGEEVDYEDFDLDEEDIGGWVMMRVKAAAAARDNGFSRLVFSYRADPWRRYQVNRRRAG